MPKINVYLPDDLAEAVKESGVSVSAVCQRALEQAVQRVNLIRQTALSDLDGEDLAARIPHFTDRAITALRLGIEQARSDGTAEVGTAHLLGGVLSEGANLALHVLRAMEIEPQRIGRTLEAQASKGSERAGDDEPLRYSQTAANALELAVTEATSLGHNYVGCEHLLLGLVTEPEGTAGHVLRSLGAEPRPTRRAVTTALAAYLHLKAQAPSRPPAPAQAAGTDADAVSSAVRQELQPVIQRLEKLEHHVGLIEG
jgi:ATP-dependent Clp protease ATP-binding subunit ClpC